MELFSFTLYISKDRVNNIYKGMGEGIYINYEDWVDHCLLTNKILFDMGIEREPKSDTPKFLLMWYLYNDV